MRNDSLVYMALRVIGEQHRCIEPHGPLTLRNAVAKFAQEIPKIRADRRFRLIIGPDLATVELDYNTDSRGKTASGKVSAAAELLDVLNSAGSIDIA